jgi:putative ABC transport system permease protein
MLKNYFTLAFRNLKKHKVFSTINLLGLAIGLSVFWMIALYIADELSYDRASVNADRIYRVAQYANWSAGSFKLAVTPVPMAPTLQHDYSEIENTARVDAEGGGTLTAGEKKIKAGDIFFADNSLLSLFDYPFLYGNPGDALARPQSIVLTRSLAEKLFGNAEEALNKTVSFENGTPNLVTGVMRDVPVNSHLSFSALRSMPANYDSSDSWDHSYLYTYVLLHPKADPKKLEAKFPQLFDRYLKRRFSPGTQYRLALQPVTSIHLHSDLDYDMGRNSDIRYIYIFSAVALLILLIAVINYINLATARSSIRVKEVGIRKVVGSDRKQLIFLFLSESVLFTLISSLLAVLLAGLLLPLFNHLSGKTLSLWQFGMDKTACILLLFSLFTGLTGGLYPAFFLSGFRTIPSLKGQQGGMRLNILFRKSLVVFQFVVTIVLIAGCSVIYQQLNYVMSKDLGFNKNQVLSFHIHSHGVRNQVEALKARLLQNTLIDGASAASNPIGENNIGSNIFNFEEKNGQIDPSPRMVQSFMVDADYLKTLQINLLQGRNFSAERPVDKFGSVLVNESLIKQLGWTDPVGKRLRTEQAGEKKEAIVIGVVKDFNIYSLQHKIEPLVLTMPPNNMEEDNLYVRVSKDRIPAALQYIEATYRSFDAQSPFEYHFLDENFANQYEAEKREGRLLFIFTVLAILIACLGLFGLVTFTAGQRTKEIGVRKVLGASVPDLVALLSADLIKLVFWALVIAIPIAWFAMQSWLEDFAYHISVNAWIFVFAGLLAIAIALLTVGIQATRAAMANPIKSLRSE